jgi:hypothetical protein
MCRLTASGDRCVGREVKIETVPQRVARAALQLDEMGVNGSSLHAQIGRIRHDERGSRPVQIPPRALNPHGIAPSQKGHSASLARTPPYLQLMPRPSN